MPDNKDYQYAPVVDLPPHFLHLVIVFLLQRLNDVGQDTEFEIDDRVLKTINFATAEGHSVEFLRRLKRDSDGDIEFNSLTGEPELYDDTIIVRYGEVAGLKDAVIARQREKQQEQAEAGFNPLVIPGGGRVN